jgi:TetR/AcrR family transcriptional regulator, cholesterol catabolism regulator
MTVPTTPGGRERYERRRQELLRITAELFSEHGYEATSMVELSEATGLTSGGLYHYIGSKEQLLFDVIKGFLDPLVERARAIEETEAPADDRFRELLRTWVTHIEQHHHEMVVFGRERHVLERDPQWAEVRRSRRQFEDIVARLLDELSPPGARAPTYDPRLRLFALLGMVSYTPAWYRPGGRFDARAVADAYCDMMLEMLRRSATG